ncbi:MAG TPA: 30S ribosomal protein S20 [Dongiaceae bacterium]|jgi:small subunit ribosomal protein S20|nr:30S ribosomal protein S20 [Dongiaceae bacterium]
MAHHKSAKKRIRQTAKRTNLNNARKSRMRSYVRKAEAAIEGGDKKAALDALRVAQPELHRGVTKGVIHRNTAARKISRLNKRLKALS